MINLPIQKFQRRTTVSILASIAVVMLPEALTFAA